MRVQRIATGVVLMAGLLLLADLFLDWHRTSIEIGPLQGKAASGLDGRGTVAAVALAGLLLWEASRRFAPTLTAAEAVGSSVLGALVLAAVVSSFTYDLLVEVGTLRIAVGDRTWAAYVGLALALALIAALLLRAVAVLTATTPPSTAPRSRPRTPAAG